MLIRMDTNHHTVLYWLSHDCMCDRVVTLEIAGGEWEAVYTYINWHSVAGVDLTEALRILRRVGKLALMFATLGGPRRLAPF